MQPSPSHLYEYKVVIITVRDPEQIAKRINAVTADGWRLVTVENCQNPYGEHRYFFEREIDQSAIQEAGKHGKI
jgi:hypothetical protein